MSDTRANERKGRGFAGLTSMVSDVSEDIGRVAEEAEAKKAAPPHGDPKPAEVGAGGAALAGASVPSNPATPGSGGAGWVFGGLFLIFMLAAIIGSSGNKNSAPPSTSSWQPSANAVPAPAPIPIPAAPLPPPTSTNAEKPPVGSDLLLNAAQIRYCLTEQIRTKAIESVVSAERQSELDNFNTLVDDYNSRCGQFRYRQDDLDRIRREIEPKSEELAQAAKTKWVRQALGLSDGGKSGKTAVAAPKKPSIPKNSHLDYFGHDWECNRGFHKVGAECLAVQIPRNAKLDYLGNDWECQRGFRKVGDGCDTVRVPKNGKLDFLGNDWECNRGFRRQAEECVAVQVPANAKLDFLGNDWECRSGYQRHWNECIAL